MGWNKSTKQIFVYSKIKKAEKKNEKWLLKCKKIKTKIEENEKQPANKRTQSDLKKNTAKK